MRHRKYAMAVFAGVAFAVSACGGNSAAEDNAPKPPQVPQDAGASKVARGADKIPAPQDVKILNCDATTHLPQIGIEVTNRTPEAQRYAIEITVKDAAGHATTAYEVHNRMNPGESIPSVIPGSEPMPDAGKLTCELTKAERLVPKFEGG